jgi:peptidyl-dipeptidase Dcp
MREHQAEIDAIVANPAPASFDNTIVAMERSGQTLGSVMRVFSNLSGANTNDTLQASSVRWRPSCPPTVMPFA